jgi:hypothetical protein
MGYEAITPIIKGAIIVFQGSHILQLTRPCLIDYALES